MGQHYKVTMSERCHKSIDVPLWPRRKAHNKLTLFILFRFWLIFFIGIYSFDIFSFITRLNRKPSRWLLTAPLFLCGIYVKYLQTSHTHIDPEGLHSISLPRCSVFYFARRFLCQAVTEWDVVLWCQQPGLPIGQHYKATTRVQCHK